MKAEVKENLFWKGLGVVIVLMLLLTTLGSLATWVGEHSSTLGNYVCIVLAILAIYAAIRLTVLITK